MGKLLRYLLTGVPAEKSVMEVLEAQGALAGCGCGGGGGGGRVVEPEHLSAGARALVEGLTEARAERRIALATAELDAWLVAE